MLQGIYQGSLHIVKICQNCGFKRNQEDFFYNLILEVKNMTTIQQSLKNFVDGEIMEGVDCEQCKQRSKLEKKQYLEHLPNNLLIQLQRFTYDFDDAMSLKKINSRLEFPQALDMAPYLHEDVRGNALYHLKGVILHTGFAQAGHYRSIIKQDHSWFMFDDKVVS